MWRMPAKKPDSGQEPDLCNGAFTEVVPIEADLRRSGLWCGPRAWARLAP